MFILRCSIVFVISFLFASETFAQGPGAYGGAYPGGRYSGQQDMLADLLFNGGSSVTGTGSVIVKQTSPNFLSGFSINGVLYATQFSAGSSYNALYSGAGTDFAFQTGDAGDPRNYYKNTFHRFSAIAGASNYLDIGSAGLTFYGATSGTPLVHAQAVAGSPDIALPTTGGTVVASCASPLVCGATGQVSIPTPLPKANGGTANTAESWQYIETLTASNSATLTTSAFTSAFDDYTFVFDNIVPITDSVNFNATVESGGSFQATTYLNATAPTTSIDLETASTISNSAGKGFVGTIYLYNVNSTSVNKFMVGRGLFAVTATFAPTSINVAGYWNGGQGAVTRVRFQMSSGNINTGSIKVYGLRNN